MPQADLYLRTCANRHCLVQFTTKLKTDRLCVDCEFARSLALQKARKRPPAKPIIIRSGSGLARSEGLARPQHDLPKRRLA